MAVSKEFYEAASRDEALRAELERATLEAFGELLKERGLEEEAAKATEAAAEKVAEAHGFELADAAELDIDDLEGVSGGMKIVVIKSPKSISPILRFMLKIKNDQ